MRAVQAHHNRQRVASVDVTSQAFLSRMAELVPGIINVFNHQTMSNEYTNRSLGPMLGYRSEEIVAMGDRVISRVIHPEDIDKLLAYFKSIGELADGEICTFDYRDIAKDGKTVWVRSIDTVFDRADDGSVLRHLGIVFDVTLEKEATERLQRANEKLEERVRARTAELEALNDELEMRVAQRTMELRDINRDFKDLTFVATHDLKVPVNNMTSLTHMLSQSESSLPAEHAETLGWMRHVCQQASEKLDALICVAQAHSATLADFSEVDLSAVLECVLENLQFKIAKTKAKVSLDLDVKTIWFMPREAENILQSMIGNALRYRALGRNPCVTIKSRAYPDAVEVSITDNGSGIDLPRDEAKVFGLFKRAHTTPEGAGVSLYAIRRVLERAGGTIDVSSEVGRGSCFSFRLPNRAESV